MAEQAQSRAEQILLNMLAQLGTEGLPAPQSRIEVLLQELADLLKDTGNPKPSAGDAGKVPTVQPDLSFALADITHIGGVTVSGKTLIIT